MVWQTLACCSLSLFLFLPIELIDVFHYAAVGWSLMKNLWQWTVNGSDLWVTKLKSACFLHAVFDSQLVDWMMSG